MLFYSRTVAATLLLGLCGCGTIIAYNFPSEDPPKKGHYYLGVKCDVQAIKEAPQRGENAVFSKLFAIVDTPLSCIGDTLYAPVMLFWGQPPEAEIVATNHAATVTTTNLPTLKSP
jgi:uncharacterized protein YceK